MPEKSSNDFSPPHARRQRPRSIQPHPPSSVSFLRKTVFWLHLVIGLAAGGVIAVVAFTGATMAFQPQILAWAERDVSRVTPPSADAQPLSVEELLKRVREAQPEARSQGITVSADPTAAVVVSLGRTGSLYVNPYTGTVQPQSAKKLREFFQFVLRLHRWLALGDAPQQPPPAPAPANETPKASGTNWREVGTSIVGISTIIFLILSLSGLYLWWPRTWTLRALKTVSIFNFKLRGLARDWNWHNVIGLWSTPVLIVITITGTVMAFKPVGDWIYKRPEGQAQGAPPPGVQVSRPEPGAKPLGLDALFAAAKREFPQWETITQRSAQQQRQRTAGAANAGQAPGDREGQTSAKPAGGEGERPRGPQPANFAIRERGSWSPIPVQIFLDPYTGAVLQKESLADYGFRRAFRAIVLPLHMGTVGGLAGQIVVFLASVGGLVLVYTGFALAWRRFFGRKRAAKILPSTEVISVTIEAARETTGTHAS